MWANYIKLSTSYLAYCQIDVNNQTRVRPRQLLTNGLILFQECNPLVGWVIFAGWASVDFVWLSFCFGLHWFSVSDLLWGLLFIYSHSGLLLGSGLYVISLYFYGIFIFTSYLVLSNGILYLLEFPGYCVTAIYYSWLVDFWRLHSGGSRLVDYSGWSPMLDDSRWCNFGFFLGLYPSSHSITECWSCVILVHYLSDSLQYLVHSRASSVGSANWSGVQLVFALAG